MAGRDTGVMTLIAELRQFEDALDQQLAYKLLIYAMLNFLALDEKTQDEALMNASLLKGIYDKEAFLMNLFSVNSKGNLVLLTAALVNRYAAITAAKRAA